MLLPPQQFIYTASVFLCVKLFRLPCVVEVQSQTHANVAVASPTARSMSSDPLPSRSSTPVFLSWFFHFCRHSVSLLGSLQLNNVIIMARALYGLCDDILGQLRHRSWAPATQVLGPAAISSVGKMPAIHQPSARSSSWSSGSSSDGIHDFTDEGFSRGISKAAFKDLHGPFYSRGAAGRSSSSSSSSAARSNR